MKKILTALAVAGLTLSSGAAFAQSASIAADAGFEGVDTDRNGLVSWAEFALIYTDINEEQFNVADADGDGSLSVEEFDNLVVNTGSIQVDTNEAGGSLVGTPKSLTDTTTE